MLVISNKKEVEYVWMKCGELLQPMELCQYIYEPYIWFEEGAATGVKEFEVMVVSENEVFHATKTIDFSSSLRIEKDLSDPAEWYFWLVSEERVRPRDIVWSLHWRDPL